MNSSSKITCLFFATLFLFSVTPNAVLGQSSKSRFERTSGQCPLAVETNRGVHLFGAVRSISTDKKKETWLEVRVIPTDRVIHLNLGVSPNVKSGIQPVRGRESVKSISNLDSLIGKSIGVRADKLLIDAGADNSYNCRAAWVVEGVEGEFREAKKGMEFIKSAESSELAEAFSAELAYCAMQIQSARVHYPDDLPNNPHVLMGRVEIPDNLDAKSVSCQSELLDKGYLVTTCLSGKPIGLALHGYLPLEITPKFEDKSVENFGTVRFQKVPEHEFPSVRFQLPAKHSDFDVSNIYLSTRCGKVGAASHSSTMYPSKPIRVKIVNEGNGNFSAVGLSPGVNYDFAIDRTTEHYYTRFTPQAADSLDLGLVPLK